MTNENDINGTPELDPEILGERYTRDIRELSLLQNVVDDFSRETDIKSIIDIGVSSSGTSIFCGLITESIKNVIGIDKSPAFPPWRDISLLNNITKNKKRFKFIESDIFNKTGMKEVVELRDQGSIICYCHQMLHHFRENSCKFYNHRSEKCRLLIGGEKCKTQNCKEAVGKFNSNIIFNTLFKYSNIIFFSEDYYIGDDIDKESSQGGYLNIEELLDMFKNILKKWDVVIYTPNYLYFEKNKKSDKIKSYLTKIKPQIIMNDHITFAVINNSIKYTPRNNSN